MDWAAAGLTMAAVNTELGAQVPDLVPIALGIGAISLAFYVVGKVKRLVRR